MLISELRNRNDLLLKKCPLNNNETYIKLMVIKKILQDKYCFFKMNMNDAFSILKDLGYEKEEISNLYKMLISQKEYSKLEE